MNTEKFEVYLTKFIDNYIEEKVDKLILNKIKQCVGDTYKELLTAWIADYINVDIEKYMKRAYDNAIEEIIKPQMRGVWQKFNKVFDEMRCKLQSIESLNPSRLNVSEYIDDMQLVKSLPFFNQMKESQEELYALRTKCNRLELIIESLEDEAKGDK